MHTAPSRTCSRTITAGGANAGRAAPNASADVAVLPAVDRISRVVVLVPAFNEAGSIGATLDGLMLQSRPADLVVVVPHGCTDATAQEARKYSVTVMELPRLEHRKSKRIRRSEAGPVANGAWNAAAKHWEGVTRGASLALTVVNKLPAPAVVAPNKAAKAVLGTDTVPLYLPELPAGGSVRKRPTPDKAPDAVYFPACVGTMFGPASAGASPDGSAAGSGAGRGVQYSFEQLCALAGVTLQVPDGIDSLCCGTPWSSKGMVTGQETTVGR